MPVSFFPSVFESVGRLFMDGVLKQDLSKHYQQRKFHNTPEVPKVDANCCKMLFGRNNQEP